jgi:hypothetical protein
MTIYLNDRAESQSGLHVECNITLPESLGALYGKTFQGKSIVVVHLLSAYNPIPYTNPHSIPLASGAASHIRAELLNESVFVTN